MNYRFYCECCEKEQPYVVIDGYYLAGSILQDTAFHFKTDGSIESPYKWDQDPYLVQLNKEYFMDKANKYIPDSDIGQCPGCGDDVSIERI